MGGFCCHFLQRYFSAIACLRLIHIDIFPAKEVECIVNHHDDAYDDIVPRQRCWYHYGSKVDNCKPDTYDNVNDMKCTHHLISLLSLA
jgi:hypothetical protein